MITTKKRTPRHISREWDASPIIYMMPLKLDQICRSAVVISDIRHVRTEISSPALLCDIFVRHSPQEILVLLAQISSYIIPGLEECSSVPRPILNPRCLMVYIAANICNVDFNRKCKLYQTCPMSGLLLRAKRCAGFTDLVCASTHSCSTRIQELGGTTTIPKRHS